MADQQATVSFGALLQQRLLKLESEKLRAEAADAPQQKGAEETSYHVVESGDAAATIWARQGSSFSPIDPASPAGQAVLRTHKINRHKTAMPEGPRDEKAPEQVAALLAAAENLAAVSGRFDPHQLLPPQTPEETRLAVLSRLASLCVVETHEGGVRWLLQKEPRRDTLARLKKENQLGATLRGALPETDGCGHMLRKLLSQGAGLNLKRLGREDLLALASAMEATAGVELPQPDEAEVRRLTVGADFLSDYDVLLSKGFFGRHQELSRLNEFLTSGNVSKSYEQMWGGFMLTGVGGAGKSTLLAKFARDLVKHQRATVVVLDFDRPGIDAGDSYWLEQEICRQVGRQYSETEDVLRRHRRDERRYRAEYIDTVERSTPEAAEFDRSSRSIIWRVRDVLPLAGAAERPFLLVLDTFEEVSEYGAGRVLHWLSDLASALEPTPLKVIFSGRLFDADRELLERYDVAESVEVNELEPAHAERLLVNNGVPAPAARRLARSDVIPRRPLELTLLAKLTADFDKTVEELEQELRQGGEAASKLFAGLVYRRVLRRLDDPTAQQLAYPGLVLRYVTPELIREVLAPALDLPPFDRQGSEQALEALASCNWLAYRGRDGEVWHRKDLRRSTLKAMIAHEPQKARRINETAVKYFSRHGGEREAAEAVYHRLMLTIEPNDGEGFELAELKKANDFIGADIADLPPPAVALLRFAATGKVVPHDVELLPFRYFQAAYNTAGKHLVKSRQFGKALGLLRRRERLPTAFLTESDASSWETEAAFATASWGELRRPLLRNFLWPKGVTLKFAADLLYPYTLVQREVAERYVLERLLDDVMQNEKALVTELSGVEGEAILHRLTVSLISVCAPPDPSVVMERAVSQILRQQRKLKSKKPTAPVLQRRLLFLERSLTRAAKGEYLHFKAKDPFELNITVQTLKLDSEWVASFPVRHTGLRGGAQSGEIFSLLRDVGKALRAQGGSQKTVRRLLAAVDGLSKEHGSQRGGYLLISPAMTDPETFLEGFRGPDPEFRDPCRYALLEAFPDRPSRRRLGEIIGSLVNLGLDDLAPDAFADALAADPEQALEGYVELVDRAWALGELLRRVCKGAPTDRLEMVLSAYERWDEAVRTAVRRAF